MNWQQTKTLMLGTKHMFPYPQTKIRHRAIFTSKPYSTWCSITALFHQCKNCNRQISALAYIWKWEEKSSSSYLQSLAWEKANRWIELHFRVEEFCQLLPPSPWIIRDGPWVAYASYLVRNETYSILSTELTGIQWRSSKDSPFIR